MGKRNKDKYDNKENSCDLRNETNADDRIKGKGKYARNSRNRNNRNSAGVKDSANNIINNAAWYIPDPELRKQVASYSMNSTIGVSTKLKYNQSVYPGLDHAPYSMRVPSVLAMECNPSPGFTPDSQSGKLQYAAINKAARMLYADISSINAKTTQYQPQDLVFAILSVGEIISIVSHLTRMYGVAFNYSMRNRDIPDSLLIGMKVDPDSLLDDLSGFRMRLNSILVSANQLTMFSNIPYFNKCWDMYSQIYTDGLSSMSQIYMTVPYSTWVMDEAHEGGTILNTRVLAKPDGGMLTAQDWLNLLEEMVDTLLTSTTYNYIYTDILNYVNKKGGTLYSFGYVSEMYRVTPVYNLEYLLQLHNAVPYGVPTDNNVTQNVGFNAIEFHPTRESAFAVSFMDKILDFPHTSNPTEEDKINAIIYHCAASAGDKASSGSNEYLTASAVLSDHYVVQFTMIVGKDIVSTVGYRSHAADGFNKFVDYLTKFDWAPIIYIINVDGSVSGVIGDLNFYDVVPYDIIEKTFDYSLLGIFRLGSKE